MSKVVNIGRGIRQATSYGKRMERLSNRIFGEVVRPTDSRSMKIVRMFSKEPYEQDDWRSVSYFPNQPMFHYLTKLLRMHGIYRDEHQDFRDEQNRLKTIAGKVIRPVIGEGKRAKLRGGKK
uniref:Small ribosomal subunit protein mS33 n=1 Tax=Plectus sambesii TaxID=2011161 RepID=A0A914VYW8_9BILA